MIVTVYWEDQLSGSNPRSFGPHLLLVSCVRDRLEAIGVHGMAERIQRAIEPNPRKGNSKLLREIRHRASMLAPSTWAVIDRDRILALLETKRQVVDCRAAICTALKEDWAPGTYGIALLEDNVETLVEATCALLGKPIPRKRPDERDRVLSTLAWRPDPDERQELQTQVPSFKRLVDRVTGQLAFILEWPE